MIGYRTVKENSIHWRDNQGGLFPLSPPRMLHNFNVRPAENLLKETGAQFIRWESEFDQISSSDWWHIIKSEGCALEELSSNTRSKVRRGLKAFDCQRMSRNDVLTKGYEVYTSAFVRYETHEKQFSAAEFSKAVEALPEQTEFWGVREKDSNKIVAFSENYVEDNTCFYNTIWFDPNALRRYSSYALFFEMNRHYLDDRGFRYVSDGARSLSHETQIHDFLESKFGFRKAYARLNIVYTPLLGAAVACAYPFRNLIRRVPLSTFKKASILLRQEEIRRTCAEVAN